MVERDGKGKVEGTITHFIYRDDESFFTVAVVDVGSGREAKIVGKMPGVLPGEKIVAEGTWKENDRYGGQDLQVTDYTVTEPQGIQAIVKYLASGLIEDIGPVMARRLVKAFGLETLDIIEHHPERLRTVEGIGPVRARKIAEAWVKQKAVKDVMVFLFRIGISAAYATRVYKRYGDQTVGMLEENPYLLTRVDGIGFKKADAVAKRMGIPTTSPFRVQAGTEFALQEAQKNGGHCYLPLGKLHQDACRLLGVPAENVDDALRSLVRGARVCADGRLEDPECRVYLMPLYNAESKVGTTLAAMSKVDDQITLVDRDAVEAHMGHDLSDRQWEAVVTSVSRRVSIVTGGPGTGKTTVLKAMLYLLRQRRESVALAAPTGRAAKRMEESTGLEARTIHRLLAYHPDEGWRMNAANPLPAGTVIIDEVSMVDINLAYRLVDALTDEHRLILVGDVDQLPSVGPGAVLRDVIQSEVVPVTRLDVIYRQAQGSMIIANAHRVQAEEKLVWQAEEGQAQDMEWIDADPDPTGAQVQVLEALQRLREEGFDPVRDVQILTPMRKGPIGTEGLNRLLQGRLNKHGEAALRFQDGGSVRVGDKVMQTRNDYELEVYNGDIGTVVNFDAKPFRLYVRIDGQTVEYTRTQTWNLQLAYACTIHKYQGSQLSAIIVIVHWSHYIMLARNLFYTAITRGERKVIVVGMGKARGRAVSNNRPVERFTHLMERLRKPRATDLFGEAAGAAK